MRTIEVAGHSTVLDNRSFRIFQVLSERFGDCLTKEELLSAAWPGQLVQENSLAKAISKLRRAVSGSAVEIVASYGLGYVMRMAASSPGLNEEATATADVPLELATSAPSPPPARPRPASWAMGKGAVVLCLSIIAAGAAVLSLPHSGALTTPRIVPLVTHDPRNSIATILWVDDHPANNRAEVALFKERHIAVHLAETTEDALKLLAMNRYDLVISDLGRGEDRLAGLKMAKTLRQRKNWIPVLIYTIRPSTAAGQEAQRRMVADAGVTDLVLTPQEVRAEVFERLPIAN